MQKVRHTHKIKCTSLNTLARISSVLKFITRKIDRYVIVFAVVPSAIQHENALKSCIVSEKLIEIFEGMPSGNTLVAHNNFCTEEFVIHFIAESLSFSIVKTSREMLHRIYYFRWC